MEVFKLFTSGSMIRIQGLVDIWECLFYFKDGGGGDTRVWRVGISYLFNSLSDSNSEGSNDEENNANNMSMRMVRKG